VATGFGALLFIATPAWASAVAAFALALALTRMVSVSSLASVVGALLGYLLFSATGWLSFHWATLAFILGPGAIVSCATFPTSSASCAASSPAAHVSAVAVLGPGRGDDPTILARDGGRDVVRDAGCRAGTRVAAERENRRYLPGIRIPERVDHGGPQGRLSTARTTIVAAPSIGVRALREGVAPLLGPRHHILSATKGPPTTGTA
jgi:hypothetical protein